MDLPNSWDDEPFDDLLPPPAATSVHGGRLQHWSDSHDDLPELDIDEVWDRAVDSGISYEQAEARMMKAQMQTRQWRDVFGGSVPNTHVTTKQITNLIRDLTNTSGSSIWYDPESSIIRGSSPVPTATQNAITHTPIPNDDPAIGAIWNDIMDRTDPDRIITPDDPDYGHHARLISYEKLWVDENRQSPHLTFKDIDPT